MDNGTYHYDLEMRAPLGMRRGNLELIVWGDFLNGYLTMFTRTIPIQNGSRDGNNIFFSGDMKTLMNMLPYKAEGTVSENGITLVFSTSQGQYPSKGSLTERRN